MATAAAPKKGCKLDKAYPPVAAIVDIGVRIFLSVIAANAVRTAQFQSVVLGIIEFVVGVIYALCAIIKLQPINVRGPCRHSRGCRRRRRVVHGAAREGDG